MRRDLIKTIGRTWPIPHSKVQCTVISAQPLTTNITLQRLAITWATIPDRTPARNSSLLPPIPRERINRKEKQHVENGNSGRSFPRRTERSLRRGKTVDQGTP